MSNSMPDIEYKILEYIRKNKVSTTEIADCLGKTGVILGIQPINRGHYAAGKVKWVYGYNESNYEIHEQIRAVEPEEIVYIEAFNCKERSVFGELVSKFLLLYQGALAVVTNGNVRDAHRIIKENYPIWSVGVSPVGCFNNKNAEPFSQDIIDDRNNRIDGAIMVCDDCGVVLVENDKINEEFLEKIIAIEAQEDIWFDCIDRRKWDTFDTVCRKRYLET